MILRAVGFEWSDVRRTNGRKNETLPKNETRKTNTYDQNDKTSIANGKKKSIEQMASEW